MRFSEIERNLGFWNKRYIAVHKTLKLESLAYSMAVFGLVSFIIAAGILTKEDASITVEDFYVGIDSGDKLNEYSIKFAGLVPSDFVDDLDLKKINKIKFYFNPAIKELQKENFKSSAEVRDVSFKSLSVLRDKDKYYFSQYLSDFKVVRPLEAGLLTMRASNVDLNGNNLIEIMNNHQSGDEYSDTIKKAKVVFGERSLLRFWIKKLFDKSTILKKAGYLLD